MNRPDYLGGVRPDGFERRVDALTRRVEQLERAPWPAPEAEEQPEEEAIYLLLGSFYADADSVSMCLSNGRKVKNRTLAAALVEAASGVAGAGFLVALSGFTVNVYDRAGRLKSTFDANSGGTTYTSGVFVAASKTHIYTLGTATATRRLKRFTSAGVFVDELNVTGGTDFVLAGKRDADEVWVGEYLGSSDWKIMQYVDMVAGDTFTIDLSVPLVSAPENIDIDEDGLMYGLCTRDDAAGWRVIKVDLSDGTTVDLVDGSDTSYARLAVGGRHKPAPRSSSLLYVAFQGASAGNGFVEIRNASDGSLIATVNQSTGTDNTFGIARQKV